MQLVRDRCKVLLSTRTQRAASAGGAGRAVVGYEQSSHQQIMEDTMRDMEKVRRARPCGLARCQPWRSIISDVRVLFSLAIWRGYAVYTDMAVESRTLTHGVRDVCKKR